VDSQLGAEVNARSRRVESEKRRIRTLIVDDELLARQRLRELCRQEADVEVVGECSHGGEAVQLIEALRPDLLLLDVEMRETNGFEVLRCLANGTAPLVVFVSAFEHYAFGAFDVQAVDYLLKPFDRSRFQLALSRVRQRLAAAQGSRLSGEIVEAVRGALATAAPQPATTPKRIVAEKDERLTFIDPQDIDCVEADRNYISIRVGTESYRMRSTMQQAQEMLDPSVFLRIHRSVIINTLKIGEMERWFHGEFLITLKNGQRFTSGRSYRRQIQAYLHSGKG
jgi:two-component system, LytTR family, response regulator